VLAFLDRIDVRGSGVERWTPVAGLAAATRCARPPTHLIPVNHVGPLERAGQLEGLGLLGRWLPCERKRR
jgi:hypothetical protein